jgi:hypothetical protein
LQRAIALRQTERVPEFCSCGAELPPDARFCHKCGKPQREEDVLAGQPAASLPLPPSPPPPAPVLGGIGFRNPLAFRIGFLTALLALFLNLLVFIACPLWLVAAGFFGVYLYQRRSGQLLSVRSGAKMGWLTGVMTFLLSSVPLSYIYVEQVTQPDYSAQMRDSVSRLPFPPGLRDQMLASLQTPAGIATQVLTLLIMLFVLFTLFPLLGGALGAKVLSKD